MNSIEERCSYCNGTGKLGFQLESCWFCDGTGKRECEKLSSTRIIEAFKNDN